MTINIEDDRIEMSNKDVRRLVGLLTVGALVIVIAAVVASMNDPELDFWEELFGATLADLRILGVFILPFFGILYLLATDRMEFILGPEGIVETRNGKHVETILWNQVSEVERLDDNIKLVNSMGETQFTILTVEFMISNDEEKIAKNADAIEQLCNDKIRQYSL